MNIFDILVKKRRTNYFKENPETAVFTCVHVINKERPILRVVHDEGGDWQFLCGDIHSTEYGRIISLKEICQIDNSILKISNIKKGQIAIRADLNSKWVILCTQQ